MLIINVLLNIQLGDFNENSQRTREIFVAFQLFNKRIFTEVDFFSQFLLMCGACVS